MKRVVGHEVKCLSNLFRREMERSGEHTPFTVMQVMFIGYLARHNECDHFQKDLEAEFRIRRSTATGILQLMERDGLIRRESVESDARLKRIVLTDQAMETFRHVDEELMRVEEKTTRGLTPQELETFFTIMDKMKKNLEPSQEEHANDKTFNPMHPGV